MYLLSGLRDCPAVSTAPVGFVSQSSHPLFAGHAVPDLSRRPHRWLCFAPCVAVPHIGFVFTSARITRFLHNSLSIKWLPRIAISPHWLCFARLPSESLPGRFPFRIPRSAFPRPLAPELALFRTIGSVRSDAWGAAALGGDPSRGRLGYRICPCGHTANRHGTTVGLVSRDGTVARFRHDGAVESRRVSPADEDMCFTGHG